jgi:predicted restriction endonuclease
VAVNGIGEGNSSSEDMELAEDINNILDQQEADATTKERMIEARLGQGKFKREVIDIWKLGTRCAVTGIDIPELLVASHIIPWRDSDDAMRLDGTNGLLLCAHLDKLFDRYLFSFGDNWKLVLSDSLSPTQRARLRELGIDESLQLNTSALKESDKARIMAHLERHRQRLTDLCDHARSR